MATHPHAQDSAALVLRRRSDIRAPGRTVAVGELASPGAIHRIPTLHTRCHSKLYKRTIRPCFEPLQEFNNALASPPMAHLQRHRVVPQWHRQRRDCHLPVALLDP